MYVPGKEFGLVTVGTIRGHVHAVRYYLGVNLLHNEVQRDRDVLSIGGGETGCISNILYLNWDFTCR